MKLLVFPNLLASMIKENINNRCFLKQCLESTYLKYSSLKQNIYFEIHTKPILGYIYTELQEFLN